MTITRIIDGKAVDIELTDAELTIAFEDKLQRIAKETFSKQLCNDWDTLGEWEKHDAIDFFVNCTEGQIDMNKREYAKSSIWFVTHDIGESF